MSCYMRVDGKKWSVALLIGANMIGCHLFQYIGGPSSGSVLVVPSKSWFRPGTTGKETFDQRQACLNEALNDPEYIRLNELAKKQHVAFTEGTKEQKKIMLAAGQYQADKTHNCLVSKGYKYGKVRPDQVYIPPPPAKRLG